VPKETVVNVSHLTISHFWTVYCSVESSNNLSVVCQT